MIGETTMALVNCPTCGEEFDVPEPSPDETPCVVDYDCEVCCSPMEVSFEADGDGFISAWARGLVD